jgi:polysaccharide pyruvyl transferase WcaK-like protein
MFSRVLLVNTCEREDLRASQILYRNLRSRIHVLSVDVCKWPETLHELRDIVGRCSVVISSRMSTAIVAKSCGVPVVGVSWDKKILGFFELVGMQDFCVAYENCSAEWLMVSLETISAADGIQESDTESFSAELNGLSDYMPRAIRHEYGSIIVPQI